MACLAFALVERVQRLPRLVNSIKGDGTERIRVVLLSYVLVFAPHPHPYIYSYRAVTLRKLCGDSAAWQSSVDVSLFVFSTCCAGIPGGEERWSRDRNKTWRHDLTFVDSRSTFADVLRGQITAESRLRVDGINRDRNYMPRCTARGHGSFLDCTGVDTMDVGHGVPVG